MALCVSDQTDPFIIKDQRTDQYTRDLKGKRMMVPQTKTGRTETYEKLYRREILKKKRRDLKLRQSDPSKIL